MAAIPTRSLNDLRVARTETCDVGAKVSWGKSNLRDEQLRRHSKSPLCFVSYGWANGGHAFAKQLCVELRTRGVSPWLDEECVPPGMCLTHTFRHAVLQQCDVFLAVIGPAWQRSDTCRDELSCAIKRREEEGLQVVPILWQSIYPLPDAIQDLCYLELHDLSDVRAIDKLAASLRRAASTYHLVRRLQQGRRGERHVAAQLLGTLANLFTLPALIRSLREDRDELTRYWAAIAIGNIGTEPGCQALRDAMESEKDSFVRDGIQDALARACGRVRRGAGGT